MSTAPLPSSSSVASSLDIPGAYPPSILEDPSSVARPDSKLDQVPEEELSVPVESHATQTTPTIMPPDDAPNPEAGYFGASAVPIPQSGASSLHSSGAQTSAETPDAASRKDYTSADTKFPLLFPSPALESGEDGSLSPRHPTQGIQSQDDFPRDVKPSDASFATSNQSEIGQEKEPNTFVAVPLLQTSRSETASEHASLGTITKDQTLQPADQVRGASVASISNASLASSDTQRPDSVPQKYLAMAAYSQESLGAEPEFHEGLATHHPERITLSTIDVPPLEQHDIDPLEEGTVADDEDLASRENAALTAVPSDSKAYQEEPSEKRPDATRLNTLHQEEIALIPAAAIPVAAAGLASRGHTAESQEQGDVQQPFSDLTNRNARVYDQNGYEGGQPNLYYAGQRDGYGQPQNAYQQQQQPYDQSQQGLQQVGTAGYVHPWDRQHANNNVLLFNAPSGASGGGKALHPTFTTGGTLATHEGAPPQAVFMHSPQPVYPQQAQIAQLNRTQSKNTLGGSPSIAEERRAGILDSMAGVPDPTSGDYGSTASHQRDTGVFHEEGLSRAHTPSQFYENQSNGEHENATNSTIGRTKTKSVKSSRASGEPLGERYNRPVKLQRRHTLPDNPLWGVAKTPKKKKSGFWSRFKLPENPLYAGAAVVPKHHRLPESPFLRSQSTRSKRSVSESGPSHRYSQASGVSRTKSIPSSPWSASRSSRRTSKVNEDSEEPRPWQRKSSIMARSLSQRRKSLSQSHLSTAQQDENDEVQHEAADVVGSPRASVRSRPVSVRSHVASVGRTGSAAGQSAVAVENGTAVQRLPTPVKRPQSILKNSRPASTDQTGANGYRDFSALEPTYSYAKSPLQRVDSSYSGHASARAF